jgi:acylphosphatase
MALSLQVNGRRVDFPPGNGLLWQIGNVSRKRMQILYAGNVQGVGFRYSVKSVATGFEITGTVRNLSDGRVELIAEGTKEELEAFRCGIHDSGLDHFIRNENVSWSESQNDFRGFEIVR